MSDRSATLGTFADFKIIRGRKCAQLVIEIPLEQADAALTALGGLPNPAMERWVAVARMDPKAISRAAEEPKQLPAPEKERKKWEEMPLSQQAAIRCAEEPFLRFLDEEVCAVAGWNVPSNADEAAQIVRRFCGVSSRSELNDNTQAAETWKRLEADYWAWQRGMH